MLSHTELQERLSTTVRYKKLLDLKSDIKRSMSNMTFSIYDELIQKVDEKIRAIEYPMCGSASVSIIFSNGLKTPLDPKDCLAAANNDSSLSSYIFSKYRSAADFSVEGLDMGRIRAPAISGAPEEPIIHAPSVTLQDMKPAAGIEEQMQNLSARVDRIEKVIFEEIPRIGRRITDLDVKMDFLYRKIIAESK